MIKLQKQKMNRELEAAGVIKSSVESSIVVDIGRANFVNKMCM